MNGLDSSSGSERELELAAYVVIGACVCALAIALLDGGVGEATPPAEHAGPEQRPVKVRQRRVKLRGAGTTPAVPAAPVADTEAGNIHDTEGEDQDNA